MNPARRDSHPRPGRVRAVPTGAPCRVRARSGRASRVCLSLVWIEDSAFRIVVCWIQSNQYRYRYSDTYMSDAMTEDSLSMSRRMVYSVSTLGTHLY